MPKSLNFMIKGSIYGAVLLMPLFFLPFTVEPFEINKLYLLFLFTIAGLLAWFLKMAVYEKKIRIVKTPVNLLVLFFLAVSVASSILSFDKSASIFGFYGRFLPSLFSTLSFVGFYFLLINNIRAKKDDTADGRGYVLIPNLLKVLATSILISLLLSILSLFGVLEAVSKLLPFLPNIAKIKAFSTMGGFFVEGYLIDSLEMLSLALAFIIPFVLGRITFFWNSQERIERLFNYIIALPLLVLSFLMMVVVNFWPSWASLIIGVLVFLAVALKSRLFKDRINALLIPLSVFVLALFFAIPFLFGTRDPITKALQKNNLIAAIQNKIILNAISTQSSWELAASGIKANPILGAGHGNLPYVFSKYKPQALSQGPFWQFRFDRLSSQMAETVATMGILGTVSYIGIILFFLIFGIYKIGKLISGAKENADNFGKLGMALIMFSSVIALIASQLFYYQNALLAFLFWMALAIGCYYFATEGEKAKERVFDFKDFPELGLIFTVIFIGFVIGVAAFSIPIAQNYWADVNYRAYLQSQGNNIAKLEAAASMADGQPIYHSVLALAYMNKFNQELANEKPDPDVVKNMLFSTRSEVAKAVSLAPNRITTQELAGVIFRDMRPSALTLANVSIVNLEKALQQTPDDQKLMGDLEQVKALALEFDSLPLVYFEKAAVLDPSNPVVLTELGKLKKDKGDMAGAKAAFLKAIEMRQDYVMPYMQVALIYEAEGSTDLAKANLQKVIEKSPTWVEAIFQLGRMYYNEKNYDEAIGQFQTALKYFPDHSNSMYSLAKIYQKRGDTQKALQLLERVLELNPGNQDVVKEVSALKGTDEE